MTKNLSSKLYTDVKEKLMCKQLHWVLRCP